MAVCPNCSRELQPEWKFCIYCGTPTGAPVAASVVARADAVSAVAAATSAPAAFSSRVRAEPVPVAEPEPALEPEPTPEPALAPKHEPAVAIAIEPDSAVAAAPPALHPEPHVLRAEDIPADQPTPTLRPRATPTGKVNILAVLALILGCLVSPLAALFGHLALNQISRTGERGTAIAWVAIVLGYLSLAALLVLGISYLVLNA